MRGSALRSGARRVAPIAAGVVPFGLVFGATTVDAGYGLAAVVALSAGVFAGASQLAAVELLDGGATVAVAVTAALVVNLRMVLYGVSLAPELAHEPLHRRLGAAYFLTDQAYAVTIAERDLRRGDRLGFFVGAGVTLWSVWQVSSVSGAVLGSGIPDVVPLSFAVPMMFLALVMPTVTDRPALVAAVAASVAAVGAAQVGAGDLALLVGAVAGIAVGTLVDTARSEP